MTEDREVPSNHPLRQAFDRYQQSEEYFALRQELAATGLKNIDGVLWTAFAACFSCMDKSPTDLEVGFAQAVELCAYVAEHAKGSMVARVNEFLSTPHAVRLSNILTVARAGRPANQDFRDQVAELVLTDPQTGRDCSIVSELRRDGEGWMSFDVQAAEDQPKWTITLKVVEAADG